MIIKITATDSTTYPIQKYSTTSPTIQSPSHHMHGEHYAKDTTLCVLVRLLYNRTNMLWIKVTS